MDRSLLSPILTATAIVLGLGISSAVLLRPAVSTPIPQAPLNHLYPLKFGDRVYPIKYGFLDNGTVENIDADPSSKSVTVTIKDYYDNSSYQERLFSIQFPRAIFNANVSWSPSMAYTGCAKQAPGDEGWNAGGNDIPFTVVVKNNATYLGPHVGGETCTRYSRVVSTSYPSGVSEIQITGTNMVPEFSQLSVTIASTAAISAAAIIAMRIIKRE